MSCFSRLFDNNNNTYMSYILNMTCISFIRNNIMYCVITICIVILILYYLYFKYKANEVILDENINANDVSELNLTPVFNTVHVKNVSDIVNTIHNAMIEERTVSMCGTKHSMGGQSIANMGYRLDMTNFNKILGLDLERKLVTVEPGILWCDLIRLLNKYGLSPMTLQSYSTFSVGGSISVNAHGITNDYSLAESIFEISILNAKNKIVICNRKTNPELFSLVIGGYGLFGVMLSITLRVVPNAKLHVKKYNLNTDTFHTKYEKILKNKNVNVKLARINIDNMNEIYLYCYFDNGDSSNNIISNLSKDPSKMSVNTQVLYKWLLPLRTMQKLRYKMERESNKPLDVTYDVIDRNQLLYESAEPLAKLYNGIIDLNKTHILQEYFIPPDKFKDWMMFLQKYFVNKLMLNSVLLNITIRYVKKDDITFLKYAKNDCYAFVFYFRISKDKHGDKELNNIHLDLTDEAIKLGGLFYLPYRHHYDKFQLLTCYPEMEDFMKMKLKYDPKCMFSNLWYDFVKELIE